MWPYTGRRAFRPGVVSAVDLTAGAPVPTQYGPGNLDNEYYRRLVSPSPGQLNFPTHHIATDGRVYTDYGLTSRDITDLYAGDRQRRHRQQAGGMKPSKQLHERNVNRLKVVLSMPAKERKMSLSHVTGAIMRNEIVPTESRLQNDAFLSDYIRTSTPKLPPLPRKSMQMAQKIQVNVRAHKKRPSHPRYEAIDQQSEEEDGSDLILPAITVDAGKGNDIKAEKKAEKDEIKAFRLRGAMPTRRRSSVRRLFRAKEKQEEVQKDVVRYYEKSFVKQLERKDSVGRTTEAISEQFRAVIQDKQAEKKDQTSEHTDPNVNLNIAGKSSCDALPLQLASDAGKTGFRVRHEYGKNLEKNWFKNYVLKQSKSRTKPRDHQSDDIGLRLDIFYSPEPVSDSEIDESYDNGFLEDDTSIQCGGFSTAAAAELARRRSETDRRISNLSTGAIYEEDEILSNDNSSQSDIEIVLKDNQLIQRRTKHKMRKKRQRQMKRYKTFMSEETKAVPTVAESDEDKVQLTDQEIRAIRLNLRNKDRLKKLKGKRKFLQIANAVYIVAQFKRILKNIRLRKKKIIKKRQQRIAALVAKRIALKETREAEPDADDEEEREPTPEPTLKEQFMNEFGNKLVFDIERLNIDSQTEIDEDRSDQESVVEQGEKSKNPTQNIPNTYVSKFAMEIKKVSLNDTNRANKRRIVSDRLFKRRNSIPRSMRPLEFVTEVPVKPKRKPNNNKGSKPALRLPPRRPPSPEVKCACNKRLGAASRSSFHAQSRLGKCQHQEVKKPRMKKVRIQTGALYRPQSMGDLRKLPPLELRDLLKDIDLPAKEIRLQILDRKFRRQRRRKQRIRLSPCRLPEHPREVARQESKSGSDGAGSGDQSDKSDYDFVYGGPFVGCGVMWNQTRRSSRPSWTSQDVDREVKRITRVFHELKDCSYLRLDSFNAAIIARLNEKYRL